MRACAFRSANALVHPAVRSVRVHRAYPQCGAITRCLTSTSPLSDENETASRAASHSTCDWEDLSLLTPSAKAEKVYDGGLSGYRLDVATLPNRFSGMGNVMFPSVTTILSNTKTISSRCALDTWKKNTSQSEQKNIPARGTFIHKQLEDHYLGTKQILPLSGHASEPLPTDWQGLMNAASKATRLVSRPRCVEAMIASSEHAYAGTMDIIADLNGISTLIDWKSSGRLKSRTEIENFDYPLQLAAYFFGLREVYPTEDVQQAACVLLTIDGDCETFIFTPDDMMGRFDDFLERLRQFRDKYPRFMVGGSSCNVVAQDHVTLPAQVRTNIQENENENQYAAHAAGYKKLSQSVKGATTRLTLDRKKQE